MAVTVAVGSDDVYSVAKYLVKELETRGFKVELYGALKTGSLYPWPKVGYEVAKAVAEGRAKFGVVICYTGTGVCIAANKVKGVRAALCVDSETARGARLWNDANVLALSARLTTEILAKEILDFWLSIESPDPSEVENIRYLSVIEETEHRG